MTNRTPIQAITVNWIKQYTGMTDHSAIHLEGANADGTTFDQAISVEAAKELLDDLEDAILEAEHHHDRGAAFDRDPGRAA